MNRIEIIGHIGNDATVKDLNSNQVINFSVAVSESYLNKDKEKITNTIWFECARWSNNTQIAQYLKKGQQVYISGKPNNRAWQNENGDIKVVNGILVEKIELLGKAENSQSTSNNQSTPQPKQEENYDINEQHDDLPF